MVPAKKRRGSGTYTPNSTQKYALENGNERARRHFLSQFPNLKESTIRSFKKAYKQELDKQWKKSNPQPVMVIPAKPKGHPLLLLDLDERLIKFLKAVRTKGSVVNIHVVRAAAKALIASNPSSSKHLQNSSMPRSWVQSLWDALKEQALLHVHQFKDFTMNVEGISYKSHSHQRYH